MKVYKVKQLNKVNPTKYIEGDFFLTKQSIAMLHNGKIEPLVKQSDIRKIVKDELKKVNKNESI